MHFGAKHGQRSFWTDLTNGTGRRGVETRLRFFGNHKKRPRPRAKTNETQNKPFTGSRHTTNVHMSRSQRRTAVRGDCDIGARAMQSQSQSQSQSQTESQSGGVPVSGDAIACRPRRAGRGLVVATCGRSLLSSVWALIALLQLLDLASLGLVFLFEFLSRYSFSVLCLFCVCSSQSLHGSQYCRAVRTDTHAVRQNYAVEILRLMILLELHSHFHFSALW